MMIKVGFNELEKYNKIEMLKVFDRVREYQNIYTYTIKNVEKTTIDFAKEESMTVWRSIMNEDTCGIFVIEENGEWVAGCVVVTHSTKIHMLENDMTNAVLWDIRVDTKYQGKGYGSTLMNKAIEYAKSMNTKRLLIETQNNNPKACSFYEKQGATLYKLNKNHYEEYPLEDQLIYKIDLSR